jgi:hypothetical protein
MVGVLSLEIFVLYLYGCKKMFPVSGHLAQGSWCEVCLAKTGGGIPNSQSEIKLLLIRKRA